LLWSNAVVTDPWPPIQLPGDPGASVCPLSPQMEACRGFLPGVSTLPRQREWGTAALADSGSVWIWFDNKAPSVCSQAPYIIRVGVGRQQKVEMETRRHPDGMAGKGTGSGKRGVGERLLRGRESGRMGRSVGLDPTVHFLPLGVGRGWFRTLACCCCLPPLGPFLLGLHQPRRGL
jgi:hypothetical protein